jgi:hypothetical protein
MAFDNFSSLWQIYIDVIAGLNPQSMVAHAERPPVRWMPGQARHDNSHQSPDSSGLDPGSMISWIAGQACPELVEEARNDNPRGLGIEPLLSLTCPELVEGSTWAAMTASVSLQSCSRKRWASSAAMQPVPALVMACRYTWSCTSPAANTPGTLVIVAKPCRPARVMM